MPFARMFAALLVSISMPACAADLKQAVTGQPAAAIPPNSVRFRDRVVDLTPFLLGFPYSRFMADLENDTLFFLERTPEGTWLRQLTPGEEGPVDLVDSRRVCDVDWSKRSLGRIQLHAANHRLYVTSDEKNDERLNVYSIDLETGALAQVTDSDYTYGWNLSEDGRFLAYLSRAGRAEPFETTLRLRDLETGEDRAILNDEGGADRFTWSRVQFTPDDSGVVLAVQHDGNRNTTSLARVRFEEQPARFEFLHETRVRRFSLSLVEGWPAEHELLFLSSEAGFQNLYRMNVEDGSVTQLTDFQDELRSCELLETEPPAALIVLGRPTESELVLVDAASGEPLARRVIPATVSLMDAYGDGGLFSMSSIESQWEARRFRVARNGSGWSFEDAPFAGIPQLLRRQTQQLAAERVSYPTFDRLEDGSPRELHAFLLNPLRPPERDEDRLIVITSFYGGSNRFDMGAQILAAMGIATFSPAPRGSRGFGAAFAALNDGDLGGDEIVDIHYAAKWLVRERGYRPSQIGVHGSSHGGYATMRCLTFPPETNGRNESFDYGFGWSHAGFSNICSFYDSCNIPDWVIQEAGDPVTEREKLLDRSPISHVDRLRAPLLLTHGSNDWRVPVEESRSFARAAEERGKPLTLIEFEGQGHGIRGFENQVRYHQAVFSFLESLGTQGEQP